MKTLISPAEVLRFAFGGAYLPPECVAPADIAAAEQRRVLPVVGRALYEKLLAGRYADFTDEFLAPAVAACVRAAVQPRLDLSTGRTGTSAPRPDDAQPAGEASLRLLRNALRAQSRALMRRASEHLAAHAAEFPEYDPRADVLNRCSIEGGFVQTR